MENNKHKKSHSLRSIFHLCLRHFTLAILTTIVLSGCSGGGEGGNSSGGGNTNATTLTGTAAAGAPIAHSTVTLKDSAGSTLTTVTDINGTYSFDVGQHTPPFILQVRPNVEGSVPLHSFAFTHGLANITPLTNLAVYEALDRTDPTAVYDAFGGASLVAVLSSNTYPTLSEAAFGNGQAIVLQNFDSLFRNEGVATAGLNLVTTPMAPNGKGVDAVLDKVHVTPVGANVFVTRSTRECFPYARGASGVTITVDGMAAQYAVSLFLGGLSPSVVFFAGVDNLLDQYVEGSLRGICVAGLPAPDGSEPEAGQSNSYYRVTWNRQPNPEQTRAAVDQLKASLRLAARRGRFPINVVAHSWGGVIAYIALKEIEQGAHGTDPSDFLVKVSNLLTMGTPVQCLAGGCIKSLVVKNSVPVDFQTTAISRPSNVVAWTNYWGHDDSISSPIDVGALNKYVECDGTVHHDNFNPPLSPSIRYCNVLGAIQHVQNHYYQYFGNPPLIPSDTQTLSDIRSLIERSQADQPSSPIGPPTVPSPVELPLPFSADGGQPFCDTNAPGGPAVNLKWTRSMRAEFYRVFRNDSVVGSLLHSSQLSFVNKLGLTPGSTYRYRVQAINAAGNAWTDPIEINIPRDICASTGPVTGTDKSLVSKITVGPESIAFGGVKVGSCATALVAVQHEVGTAPASGSVSVNPPFTVMANRSFTVSNGGAANIEIGYCPTSEGPASQAATISSNATSINASTVSLSGTGSSVTVGSPTQPVVTTTSLPDGKVGIGYSVTLNAVGGTPPYTWSLVSGSQLPQGLTLSNVGTISGIPTSAGVVSIGVRIQDSGSPARSAQQNLSTFIEGTIPDPFSLNTSPECSNNNPQIRLNWGFAAGADYYQIYRDGLILDGVSDNVNTYLDSHVVLGTNYSYTVKAINSGGQTLSIPSGVTASCVTPPGAFTLTATPWCTGGAPVTLLEWTGSAGRTFPDDIYRDGSLISISDSNRYTDSAVIAGSTYNYFVRAKNSVGSIDSNQFTVISRSDCAVPVAPEITMISPQGATVGGGAFTLTVTGKNFDSSSRILWAVSGDTPGAPVTTPTLINSTTMTVAFTQGSSGFSSLLSNPGVYSLQVIRPGDPSFFDGLRSNISNFTVYNPILVVKSITGNCQASLNCTPSNGFDVRIDGNGFVNNIFQGATYTSSTYAEINGKPTPLSPIGQGPVFTQMQLLVNGALIPTPGTYSLKVCNAGTAQGIQCESASLTVVGGQPDAI